MSQPLNSTISVYRTVRAFREAHRQDSVASLTKRLRPLVMSVPGEEVLVGVLSRDTTLEDFSPYCGEARHDATRGFPIVVGLFDRKTFEAAQEGITGIDFAFTIGADKYLKPSAAGLTRDLHADLRNDSLVAPEHVA